MVDSLKNLRENNLNAQEDKYSLYIVGGFDDDRRNSIELTYNLFSIFYFILY
jgi:hypothetical protein